MRVAAMQPYFYPYIGYFQLIANVDCFVLLDDVQYIRRGWVNRNRIRSLDADTGWRYFSIPVRHASQQTQINQIEVSESEPWRHKLIRTLSHAYGQQVIDERSRQSFIDNISRERRYLIDYLITGIEDVCHRFGLDTHKINLSSSLKLDPSLRGAERILGICRKLNADTYINPPGGVDLYNADIFSAHGIQLVIQPECDYAPDHNGINQLSIMDVLMTCDQAKARRYVQRLIA